MSASQDPKPLIIVYHAECIDGAACAWCVAKAWGREDRKDDAATTYIPYAHYNVAAAEKKITEALRDGGVVYFVDAAPRKEFLDSLMTPAENGLPKVEAVHVLDHHASAAKELQGYIPPAAAAGAAPELHLHIDAEKQSAARMIWERLMPGADVPPVMDVINLMDGSAAGLTTPDAFAAAAEVDAHDISTPDKALQTLRGLASLSFNDMVRGGRSIVKDQDIKIEKALAGAVIMHLQVLPDQPPVPVPIVNADVKHFGRAISEKMTALGKKAGSGLAFAWYLQKTGAVTMSIRSDGNPDASAVAEHLRNTMGVTGGGHAGAGAVHFSSIFEFARHMNFASQKPQNTPQAKPSARPPQDGTAAKPLH